MIYYGTWGNGEVVNQLPLSATTAYVLVLNPMRDRTEAQRAVAASESRDELLTFWRGERVDPYKDGNWNKVYRQDGPLEWFNPPWSEDDARADDYGNGIIELRRDGWRRVA